MFLVELIVVVVAELFAEQFKVLVADDNDSCAFQQPGDVLLLVECTGILEGLVVVAESAHAHAPQAFDVLELEVEIAHQVVGEVEACQLVEHLVLVDGIGFIGDDEQEVGVALGLEDAGCNGIAVAEHIGAAFPHIAHVELSTAQLPAFFYAIDDHTGNGAHLTCREFLHDGLHVVETSLAVADIEFAETIDEKELVAIGSHLESSFGKAGVGFYLVEAVGLEGLVGGGIEGILEMGAEAGVLNEIGVAEERRPLAFGIVALQAAEVVVGHLRLAFSHVKQIEMVEHIVHLLVGRILVGKPAQGLLAQLQIVELVLEDDTAVMEAVHDDEIGGCHLLFGERDILQIILSLVGIVLGAVGYLCQRVLDGCRPEERVALFVGEHFIFAGKTNNGLVDALPVVNVLTLAPKSLESLFSLAHSHWVIEVPCAALVTRRRLGCIRRLTGIVAVSHGSLTGQLTLGIGFGLAFALFFLFLLQGFDDTVDGLVALFFGELGQHLQRVLQIDGLGVRHQFVEHLRAVGELLVVVAVFVEQSDGFAVATLGIAEFLLYPVKVAQMEQQHSFLDTAAGGLLVAFFVGGDGIGGIALQEIDVAHGIIDLVEILRILVGTGHRLQAADHFLGITLCHHLTHGDAGIELQLVRRVHAYDAAKCLVGIVALAQGGIELS